MKFLFRGTSVNFFKKEVVGQNGEHTSGWIILAYARVIVSFHRHHFATSKRSWWAKMDSNHRPHDYQSCALASWAIGPFRLLLVEISGIEPLTSCLQGRRSPSWAKPPDLFSPCLGTFFDVPSKLNNTKLLTLCTDLRTLHKKSSFLMKSP